MSREELNFVNETDEEKWMDDQRDVNKTRNLSLKMNQIKKKWILKYLNSI